MGAVPKRKISKARKNRRRAHDSLNKPALATCPKCGQSKRPHFKCPNCGHYGEVEKAQSSKTKQSIKSKSDKSKSSKKDKTKEDEKKK
jgi:large subunit ribosomal protein L32